MPLLAVHTDRSRRDTEAMNKNPTIWKCVLCGFEYDEAIGMPDEGFPPGTRWDAIPDSWSCPDCGYAKMDFEMVALA